jgi:16S rRNA processing protein RimM
LSSERRYVPLAAVARPHGVNGELRLKVYNDDSDLLLRKPTPPIRLRMPTGEERDIRITLARAMTKGMMLVRLEGVSSRDAAEAMRGAELCVPRDAFPPLDEGEFYVCDIEGARAELPGGEAIGRVVELRSYPTCSVLVVARAEKPELEVPLLDAYVDAVDVAAGVVRLRTIEGLT